MIKEFKTVLRLGSIILFVGTLIQLLVSRELDIYPISTAVGGSVFYIAYAIVNAREKKK